MRHEETIPGMPRRKQERRDQPATMLLPEPSAGADPGQDGPARLATERVLDLALGIGAVLLASGVGAVDAAGSMRAVLGAYGLRRCQVDVTYDRLLISYRPRVGVEPLTAMHQVAARSLDYSRLQAVDELVGRITAGRLDRVAANAELDRIVHAAHPYPRWVSTVALGVMAAGFAVLLGSGVWVALIAGGVTAGLDRLGRVLNQRRVLLFFQQIIGAALATAVTLALTVTHLIPGTDPSLVAAASIVVLLSGVSVVGAVQDTLTGYYLTGVARGVEIALLSVALLIGVTVAVRLALDLGVHQDVTPQAITPGLLSLPARIGAGGFAAAGAALANYASRRGALAAGLAGAGGSSVLLILQYIGADLVTSSFLAAALIGLAGGILSRRLHLAPLIIATAGIIPLVPGMTTYRGIVSLTSGDPAAGLTGLSTAFATALALGAGVLLGQFLSDPVKQRLSRLEHHYLMPGMAGIRQHQSHQGRPRASTAAATGDEPSEVAQSATSDQL